MPSAVRDLHLQRLRLLGRRGFPPHHSIVLSAASGLAARDGAHARSTPTDADQNAAPSRGMILTITSLQYHHNPRIPDMAELGEAPRRPICRQRADQSSDGRWQAPIRRWTRPPWCHIFGAVRLEQGQERRATRPRHGLKPLPVPMSLGDASGAPGPAPSENGNRKIVAYGNLPVIRPPCSSVQPPHRATRRASLPAALSVAGQRLASLHHPSAFAWRSTMPRPAHVCGAGPAHGELQLRLLEGGRHPAARDELLRGRSIEG